MVREQLGSVIKENIGLLKPDENLSFQGNGIRQVWGAANRESRMRNWDVLPAWR